VRIYLPHLLHDLFPYPVIVFDGNHSDASLDAHVGREIARTVLDRKLKTVIDFTGMRRADQPFFKVDLTAELYEHVRRFTEELCRSSSSISTLSLSLSQTADLAAKSLNCIEKLSSRFISVEEYHRILEETQAKI